MSVLHSTLTHERLLDALDYDPLTGIFRWKTVNTARVKAGSIAGANDRHGYIQIQIDYVMHKAHRLALFHASSVYPSLHVDHINGSTSDNRLSNLREATNAENRQNIRRPRRDSSMKSIGVQRRDSKFAAKIQLNGKQIYLGRYDTEDAASSAYLSAKRQLHIFNTL